MIGYLNSHLVGEGSIFRIVNPSQFLLPLPPILRKWLKKKNRVKGQFMFFCMFVKSKNLYQIYAAELPVVRFTFFYFSFRQFTTDNCFFHSMFFCLYLENWFWTVNFKTYFTLDPVRPNRNPTLSFCCFWSNIWHLFWDVLIWIRVKKFVLWVNFNIFCSFDSDNNLTLFFSFFLICYLVFNASFWFRSIRIWVGN